MLEMRRFLFESPSVFRGIVSVVTLKGEVWNKAIAIFDVTTSSCSFSTGINECEQRMTYSGTIELTWNQPSWKMYKPLSPSPDANEDAPNQREARLRGHFRRSKGRGSSGNERTVSFKNPSINYVNFVIVWVLSASNWIVTSSISNRKLTNLFKAETSAQSPRRSQLPKVIIVVLKIADSLISIRPVF